MGAGEAQARDAVRWDTNTNRIYFDLEKSPLGGRLVLRKNRDGKIDMYITKGETLPTVRIKG